MRWTRQFLQIRHNTCAIRLCPGAVRATDNPGIKILGNSRRVAIVMSRLPRLIDPQAVWLGGLRAALRRLRDQNDTLLIAEGTAGCELVCRGARRLGIAAEFASPVASEKNPEDASLGRDDQVIQAADSVLALAIRTNGIIHNALRRRLMFGRPVELLDLPGLQAAAARQDLIGRGASLWSASLADLEPLCPDAGDSGRTGTGQVYEIVPFPRHGPWIYLSHTTRACPGPWPGETFDQYADSLLDRTSHADHSTAATLERIVRERRLRGSSGTIRGQHTAVCFTQVPLRDLPQLRQFRTHRSRWDFEAFGLCIRRSWLVERGARPVIYGNEADWQRLPEGDQPYFQWTAAPASSQESTAGTDWSVEQEWRVAGDVDLNELPPDQAFIFVPDASTASRLSAVSPWPITLWPGKEPTS